MKKRRFPRISPTMARRVVMVVLIMALGIPLMGCQVLMLWMNENVHVSDGEQGLDPYVECSYCGGNIYLTTGEDGSGHGDGVCNKKEEPPKEEAPPEEQQEQQPPQEEQPKEEQPTIQVEAQPRFTCDWCKQAIDSQDAHHAPCGFGGHYSCDDADHGACGACGDPLCDGHAHKIEVTITPTDPAVPDDGLVAAPVTAACPGCGAVVDDAADHLAPCGSDGHFTCAADYAAQPHVDYADCNEHRRCDSRDHSRCQCSIPKCSSQYAAAEHGLLACGEHCKYNIPDDIEDTHNRTPCFYA